MSIFRMIPFWALSTVAVAVGAPVSAVHAGPSFGLSAAGKDARVVVQVHDSGDDEDYEERRRHRRHHRNHGANHVDAPFTHVETSRRGIGRRVIVDAPFAHVYVSRHGRRVVAPFVDIWIPR